MKVIRRRFKKNKSGQPRNNSLLERFSSYFRPQPLTSENCFYDKRLRDRKGFAARATNKNQNFFNCVSTIRWRKKRRELSFGMLNEILKKFCLLTTSGKVCSDNMPLLVVCVRKQNFPEANTARSVLR